MFFQNVTRSLSASNIIVIGCKALELTGPFTVFIHLAGGFILRLGTKPTFAIAAIAAKFAIQ